MRKIRNAEQGAGECGADAAEFLMGLAKEFVEEAQFVHQLQGGRMDGVTAKIAEEIGVFFQDDDIDASPGEKKAEDHAGGTTADDAAAGGQLVRGPVRWIHPAFFECLEQTLN